MPVEASGHVSTDLLINPRADGAFRDPQVEIGLKPEPKLGRDAEILAQSERGVRSNSTFPVHNSADSARWDGNIPSEFIDANAHWLHELLEKDFSGMDRFEQLLARHRSLLSKCTHADHTVVYNTEVVVPIGSRLKCRRKSQRYSTGRRHLDTKQNDTLGGLCSTTEYKFTKILVEGDKQP